MKTFVVSLVLLLAVVLLVVGWLVALPNTGRYILIGALVLALIVGLLCSCRICAAICAYGRCNESSGVTCVGTIG